MNSSKLAQFKADPVAFLNAVKGKKKGVDLTITGADGTKLQTSNVTVPNAPRPLSGASKSNYSTFELDKYRTETTNFNLSFDTDRHLLLMSKDAISGATSVAVRTYYLNWATDKGQWMKLDNGADLFITARLNGCGVLIYGLPSSPTVVHANIKRANFIADPSDYSESGMAKWNKARMDLFHTFYANLAFGLTDAGIFAPASLSASGLDDSGAVSKLFEPAFYFAEGGSYAHIFGLKDSSHNWKFYAHYQKVESGVQTFETVAFWP